MGRKSKRNRKNEVHREGPAPAAAAPASRIGRTGIVIAGVIALLLAFGVGALLYNTETGQPSQRSAASAAALASGEAPTLGDAGARVHIVEFLDPACETCATFYPHVKRLMAANPGRIRLSVRHVAFHKGADQAVRILEAARNQGKYWQGLEALLANQGAWVLNHAVQVDRIWPAIAGIGLDLERIRSEMGAAEISRRMEQDLGDARVLAVTQTPEYFVNGRPLPSFGLEQLQELVEGELRRAYP